MTATIIGNRTGIYIDPCTNQAYITPESCTNYNTVNMEGVNHLVIKRDTAGNMDIIQASGYTPDKGIFCDLY